MVFRVVFSSVDVMPSHTSSHGLRLNTENYVNYLHEVLLSLIGTVAAERTDVWQQLSVILIWFDGMILAEYIGQLTIVCSTTNKTRNKESVYAKLLSAADMVWFQRA